MVQLSFQNQEGTTYDKVGEIQEKIPQQEMNGDTPANVENQVGYKCHINYTFCLVSNTYMHV